MTDGHTQRLESALAGRYKIQHKLGEGGMASVYLAEDIKHERNVALKILKPELAAVIGAERFLAEIKTTANLQHPHILPLFDSGEADGFLYYVMPYIDGETLAQKLARERQLGVDEAVKIARDVADALDYAHRNDVLHRDIKPGNILLHDGRPVVADFGIAVAISAAGGGRMTETGLSLGTPHYMSPEQASADRDLNARSDVYSLGCVLYEMIAGQPPHTGPSAQSILVRILTESPRPLTEMRHTVPPHVAAVVAKAIEKLPADRFDSARQFMDALDDPAFTYTPAAPGKPATAASPALPQPGAAGGRRRRPWIPWTVAAAMTLVAAWGALRPDASEPVQRFRLQGGVMMSTGGTSMAVSPDGTTIAYSGEDNRIYWRPVSALEAQVIPGSESSRSPFFSADGRSIGYTTGPPSSDRIRTASLDGAPPRTLAGDHFPGAAWGRDGFVYYADAAGNLFRVSEEGGDPEQLYLASDSTPRLRLPEPLPGGNAVLVHTWGGPAAAASVLALDLSTRELMEVEQGSHARFAAGYLFWVREGTLFAAPFDPDRLEFTGQGMEVADAVRPALQGSYEYAVSDAGTLIYQEGANAAAENVAEQLGWTDLNGNVELVEGMASATLADIDAVRLSPDERFVAAEFGEEVTTSADQPVQIWIFDLDQGAVTPLTFQGDRNQSPRWMADGLRVAYVSTQGEGPDGIWAQPFDRSGSDELLVQLEDDIVSFDVPPRDELPLLVQIMGPATAPDLWLAWPDSTEAQPWLATDYREYSPAISPDGRWAAYVSNESGQPEVYVRSFPQGGRPWLVSRGGGTGPVWARSGDALFYRSAGGNPQLVRATLSLGDEVRVEDTEPLYLFVAQNHGAPGRWDPFYHVADDGRLLSPIGPSGQLTFGVSEPVVVLNLFEELEARRRRR
jgi:serine/threonine-protein kinase